MHTTIEYHTTWFDMNELCLILLVALQLLLQCGRVGDLLCYTYSSTAVVRFISRKHFVMLVLVPAQHYLRFCCVYDSGGG